MSKIKILAISPDKHGIGKYRILDPYKYIGDNYLNEFHVDITFDTPMSDDYFKNYDIVVFHSYIHRHTHEVNINRIKWLKAQGIKVVMDIDDFWIVDQNHPMYFDSKKENLSLKKFELLKIVDYITTTTPIFGKTIEDKIKNKNVFIFPNSIDENESQFIPKKITSDKVRFGWIGGSSHLHDIQLLSDGIDDIFTNYKDKAQFVLCGFDTRGKITEYNPKTGESRTRDSLPSETVWSKYEKIFTKNYSIIDEEYKKFLLNYNEKLTYDDKDKPYVRKWTKEINLYANNYNNFDVCLVPLVDKPFNVNKSQLKIIEAGFHKKAVIASEIGPYTLDLVSIIDNGVINDKGNALLVNPKKNHKDWGKHMKRLIENPKLIEDMGNRLYETVKDKYSLKTTSKNRTDFFKSIMIQNITNVI
jgi:glycosyltransferase involved in cell wall biosynthesis